MTPDAEQGTMQGSYDPIVEALIRELIEEVPHAKSAKKTITDALAEELLVSLKEREYTASPASSLETVLLAEAFAPALAEALAPVLARALAPALVKALNSLLTPEKEAQETTFAENADRQE